MSWSSRNIAITDECMHEDGEAMRRYQRKSHTEEHAFLELTDMSSSMMKEMTKVKIRISVNDNFKQWLSGTRVEYWISSTNISMSLFRTPPVQRRSCHAKRDRVRRRQLSCCVVVDEKKSFLLCVSRTLSRMKERVNWLISKLLSEVCDGNIDLRRNRSNVGPRQFIIVTWHTQYLYTSLCRVQHHMTKIHNGEVSTEKQFDTFDSDSFTLKNLQTRMKSLTYIFQGRTYEHSIQNIKVPIVVRMIPRIWSLWYEHCWQRWTAQVYENVEIFPEQVKRYQMFRNGFEMSLVWWSNSKTDLRGSSGSWRWFSIDLRYFWELEVFKSTGQADVMANVRGKGRGGRVKNVIKDEKFVDLDKNVQSKTEQKNKRCLIVWSFARSIICIFVFCVTFLRCTGVFVHLIDWLIWSSCVRVCASDVYFLWFTWCVCAFVRVMYLTLHKTIQCDMNRDTTFRHVSKLIQFKIRRSFIVLLHWRSL